MRFLRVLLVLFLWMTTGFSLGTSLLTGPVRWITDLLRAAQARQGIEDAVIGLVILLYAAGTFLLSLALARLVLASPRLEIRYGLPLVAALCAGGALWLWLSPEVMGGEMPEEDAGAHFTFGPYPTRERMAALKARGYDAVISLLHPAVVPFEPKLMAEEEAAAAEVGIRLISLPMLPWVSENREALDRLQELAGERRGRYYVHCYLGQDRVNLAKRIVAEAGGSSIRSEVQARDLATEDHLERGTIVVLAEGVYLTPYPTDEEFVAYFLTGKIRGVVNLMDPADPSEARWIQKERELLDRYQLAFEIVPIPRSPYDPQAALAAARRVAAMKRPVAVHAFLSPSTGRSPAAEAFVQAWRAGVPPLPPSGMREPLGGGPIEVVAPNVAFGPRPSPSEFGGFLAPRGIRRFVRLGPPSDPEAREDAGTTGSHGLAFENVDPSDPGLLAKLADGGPWYLYGPRAAGAKEKVARAYGPAVPEAVRPGVRLGAQPGPAPAPRTEEGMPSVSAPEPPPPEEPAGRLARWVAPPRMLILLGPPLLLAAGLCGLLAGWMRVRQGVRAPFTRKVFHFLIFTLAGILQLTAGLQAVALFGAIVTAAVLYAVARGDGFPLYEAMARPGDAPRRTLFILVPLVTTAVGGVLGNLFFPSVAWIGYLVGGWGDAAGEPIGAAWGRHRYRVPSLGGVPATRSLEGSAGVLVVGILAAFLGLLAFGVPPGRALMIGAACGAAGAVTEAFSTHGLDNLTIQLAASGTAFVLLAR